MKKAFKFYKWAWIAFGVYFLALVVYNTSTSTGTSSEHHNKLTDLANDPAYIEKVIQFDLPDITDVKADSGVGSEWTSFGYELEFADTLTEAGIARLDNLCLTDKHWSKSPSDSSPYIYHQSVDNGYEIACLIYKDSSVVEYSIYDGDYDIVLFLSATMLPFCALVFCGIVLFIAASIYKWMRKEK